MTAPVRVVGRQALDVVVVNYRTPRDLDAFLSSYHSFPCFWAGNLTVVNVAPGPVDLSVVERWDAKLGLTHFVFTDNVGYARACNRGARRQGLTDNIDGDVIALFNADVVLRPDALTLCYEAIRDHPGWGVLGPRQVDAENRLVGCGIYGPPNRPVQAAWMAPDRGQCSAVRTDALTVSGSAYFVRREVWEKLTECPLYRQAAPDAEGAFLPTHHYYEETFCSYHARAHDLAAVFYGPVCIVHRWHRASRLGGAADQQMGQARTLFRAACDLHGIERE